MSSSRLTPENLCSLPEHIQYDIFSRVAANSLQDLQNLQRACRMFFNICNSEQFLRDHPSESTFPPYPQVDDPARYKSFLLKLADARNPEAMLRIGIKFLFRPHVLFREAKIGFQCMLFSAERGSRLAKYVAGVLLLSGNVSQRRAGSQFIASLMAPSVGETVGVFHTMRDLLRQKFWYSWVAGRTTLDSLRLQHGGRSCDCEGWLSIENLGNRRKPTSDICQSCLIYELVKPFFDLPF